MPTHRRCGFVVVVPKWITLRAETVRARPVRPGMACRKKRHSSLGHAGRSDAKASCYSPCAAICCGSSAGLWRSVLGRPWYSSYAVIMAVISEITTNYRCMPRYAGPTANHTISVGKPSRSQGLKPTLLVSSTNFIAQRYTRCHYLQHTRNPGFLPSRERAAGVRMSTVAFRSREP